MVMVTAEVLFEVSSLTDFFTRPTAGDRDFVFFDRSRNLEFTIMVTIATHVVSITTEMKWWYKEVNLQAL